jgi:hypothetical protein
MKAEEARTLVGFLKGAFPSMTDAQMEVYESSLCYEDAALASKAILDGIREWKFVPKYAEIVERIGFFRRAAQAETGHQPQEEGVPPPFWVKRWMYARYIANPPDLRLFREEDNRPDGAPLPEGGWMPEDAWVEEAAALTPEQITKAMSSGIGGRL